MFGLAKAEQFCAQNNNNAGTELAMTPMASYAPKRSVFGKIAMATVAFIGLSACEISHSPLTQEEIEASRAQWREDTVSDTQEALDGPVDLYEAMARAIKYNLDYKVETQNLLFARAEKEEVTLDLLPSLVMSGSYAARDSYAWSTSIPEATGQPGTYSRSSGKVTATGDLTLTWDMLDFGLSYYRAQQAGNRAFIAQEQQRRAANTLIEDVRVAFWKTVSAQRVLPQAERTLAQARRTLAQARASEQATFADPEIELNFQRDMLRVISDILELKAELNTAKAELARLINVPPNTDFDVVIPKRKTLPRVVEARESLYQRALNNRPELRELQYELANVDLSKDSAALQYLPSLRPYAQIGGDANDLLINNNWSSAGLNLSWDLIGLAKLPRRMRTLERQEAHTQARALALTQTVMSQVEIAQIEYENAREMASISAQMQNVSRQIARQVEGKSRTGVIAEQQRVYERSRAILDDIRFDRDYARLQASFARLYAAVGENNYPSALNGNESVDELAAAFRQIWTQRNTRPGL